MCSLFSVGLKNYKIAVALQKGLRSSNSNFSLCKLGYFSNLKKIRVTDLLGHFSKRNIYRNLLLPTGITILILFCYPVYI